MGSPALIRILHITVKLPSEDTAGSTKTENSKLKSKLKSNVNLESLTYKVQNSAVKSPSTTSETARLMKTCYDSLFPLALPSNCTSAVVESFTGIQILRDGSPAGMGVTLGHFCCKICPRVLNGYVSDEEYYNSAFNAGDFHLRLSALLKHNVVQTKELLHKLLPLGTRQPMDNPEMGDILSLPVAHVMLTSIPSDVEHGGKAQSIAIVEEDTEDETDYRFIYTVMIYHLKDDDDGANSAIRIIAQNTYEENHNDPDVLTPTEFKEFCRSWK